MVYLSVGTLAKIQSRKADRVTKDVLGGLDESIKQTQAQIQQATAPVEAPQAEAQDAPSFELPSVDDLMGGGNDSVTGGMGQEDAGSGAHGSTVDGGSASMDGTGTSQADDSLSRFQLPSTDSLMGKYGLPEPAQPGSEYSGALTTLGGTPEAEALTRPGGNAYTGAQGGYAPVSPDEGVTRETVTRAAATALSRAGLPVGMAPYIAGIAINEGILQPGTIARDHWSVGGVKAPGSAGVVTVPTREVINGQSVMQQGTFGKFNSMQEGMDALATFVRDSPRFGPIAKQAAQTGDYSGLIEGFHKQGYATDPNWTRQVNSIASGLTVPAVSSPATGAGTRQMREGFDPNAIVQQWAGKPYVFGGAGGRGQGVAPTDCSGFVAQLTGLPAHTDTAYRELERRGAGRVDLGQARPGDVVFYIGGGTGGQFTHHMGLYAGNGKVLDMSLGGVKERPIEHAGKFEILRDPTDTRTPDVPKNAAAPTPIVETGVAEATAGEKVKGMRAEDAVKRYANLAQLDLSGMPAAGGDSAPDGGVTASPTIPPARDDWRASGRASDNVEVGQSTASGQDGSTQPALGTEVPYGVAGNIESGDLNGSNRLSANGVSVRLLSPDASGQDVGLAGGYGSSGVFQGSGLDTQGQGVNAGSGVAPFEAPGGSNGVGPTSTPVRDDYRLDRASPPQPGGAVEPELSQAPASSGNPLEQVGQLLSEVGQKIQGIFTPQKPDYSQPAQDIQQRQATLTGEGPSIADVVSEAVNPSDPSLSRRVGQTAAGAASGAMQGLEGFADDQGYKFGRLQQLNAKRVQGTLTPEENEEAKQLSVELSQWAVPGAPMELQGVSKATREAVEGTFAGGPRAVSRGVPAPAPASGMLPEEGQRLSNTIQAGGRAAGAGAGAGYRESQQEGPPGETPEERIARIARSTVGGAATSIANSGTGAFLRPGRRPPMGVARAVGAGSDDAKRTTAFSPADPNVTYELEHRVVDLKDLITSHLDDFKPNPRFPRDLQPRQRDRVAGTQQVSRIASELNPDALLSDTRSIQTGSPIVGPDNIVESGNGRVMALREALRRNPEAAKRYREEIEKAAADYGIDPAELRGKKFPVLVRERLSDVDRKAFAREANESGTAVLSGFERSLGDAELLTDDLIAGLTVNENQSIDQALSAPGNRGIVRAFTSALPQNEAGTMMDAMGNLSEEGVRRVKQALIVKAYGNSVTGQRMARSMIESIDPGVKNVETAIYGSLPSVARLDSVSMRGDLSISNDIAKAADMYARLKQNGISIPDYMAQGSLWERETTTAQDTLIQAFDANKRSARRIREILEGYAEKAEPQANPSQGDLFGGTVARASKEDLLDSAIQEFGSVSDEAASAATPAVREGLDGGESVLRRVPEYREPGPGPATATAEGARPPIGPVRIGSDSLQPELPGSEPSRGLYVGEARRRTQKRLDDAMAKGEPITLTDEEEIARLRLDKFPEEMRPWMTEAASNADWFREQRRGVVPDVEVQASAAKMWASIDDVIKRGAAGKVYNPEETVAIRNLLRGQYEVVQDYAQRLSEPLTKDVRDRLVAEQLAEAQKLAALFQVAEGARAEAGRTLRQYREFARSLKDNPEEAGLRYIKARFGTMDGAEKAVATYTQMVQDGASPVELAAFLRNVRPAWMDRLNIIRYGSMLSSTTTHLRNIAGNIINIGQDIGLKPVAAGIDAARAGITGGQRTRYLGETSETARGMLEGTNVGLRDMWTTLRTGVNPNEIQTIDNLRGGFGSGSGKVDAVVEAPLRALSGADAFFRAVTMGGHSRAVAFRKATQEGLTGQARMERVQEIVENLHRNLDVLDEASKQSARDILQEDRAAVRAGMQLRESMNGLVPYLGDVVVPFVRTPINIAAQGLEMSPAGFISVIKDARAGNIGDATDTAARALFGTALMVGAGSLAMNGMMTGGYPEDARTRSTLPPGWQPYSLKVGDKYVQYSNLGPFGIPIATAVILAEAQKQGKPIASGATVMRLGKYMGDQTFMRGVSDFVKAFNDPSRYGENVVENIGTQFAPYASLGRQIERAMGMAQKDPHGALEALYATYPMTAGRVADRTDSRGQPIMPSQTGAEAFLSPTNISTEKPDRVLDVLRKHGIGIGSPPKSLVTSDGRNIELTPKQKQQFQQLLYGEIQQNLIDFNDPSEAERAMGRARARARDSLLLSAR